MTNNAITTCTKIIVAYSSSCKTGITIEVAMRMRDYLAAQSYFLAELAAGKKKEYNERYFLRKVSVLREEQNLLKLGSTQGKAKSAAELANEDHIQAEMDSEAEAYRADIMLRQVNQVLNAMQQRIAFLQAQYRQARVQTANEDMRVDTSTGEIL